MKPRMHYARMTTGGNPVVSALMAVLGAVVVGAALVFGFFAFLFLASVLLILAGIVGLRLWWVGRKLRKSYEDEAASEMSGGAIEGEYHIVSNRHQQERPGNRAER